MSEPAADTVLGRRGARPSPGRRLRVFLGAFGQPGHAFPMLALASALARRNHDVWLETWSHWSEVVAAEGVNFLAAPEYHVFPTREQPLQPYEAVLHAAATTREAIASVEPDVVVHDILTLAPALAGELEGRPVATLIPHVYPVGGPGFPPYAIGARLPRSFAGRLLWRSTQKPVEAGLRQGRRELNQTRQKLGLPEVDRLHGGLSPSLVLVGTFPALEYPRVWPDHVQVVGPLMWEPPFPAIELPPGDDPLVLIAPSTAQDPEHRLLRVAAEGLAGLPVRVLASINRRPLSRPVRMGANAWLVDWLSYAKTIPRASLVICHAGHGTLVRSLACGVPVLAVPHSGDMGENAARLDWSGAGVRLPWRLLRPSTLRLAAQQVLDPRGRYAERAGAFAQWAAEHEGPVRGAELVEELIRRQATRERPAPGAGG